MREYSQLTVKGTVRCFYVQESGLKKRHRKEEKTKHRKPRAAPSDNVPHNYSSELKPPGGGNLNGSQKNIVRCFGRSVAPKKFDENVNFEAQT